MATASFGHQGRSFKLERRKFLGASTFVATGLLAYPYVSNGSTAMAGEAKGAAEKLGWKLACQLYTFRRFPFYEAIERIARLGIKRLEPAFFLRLAADRPGLTTSEALSAELRAEMKQRLQALGLTMPNYYADLTTDRKQAQRVFQFAREMGVETIVSEPPPEAFPMLDELCQEFGINLAVHNHPQSPTSRYWHPEKVLAVCEGRSQRIGACCDTGHWVRSGLRPVECLRMMKGRIITMHLKDVAEFGKPEARDVILGTGVAGYEAVLKELHGQGFKGVLTIEYEHDSPELENDVAACVSFVEKVAAKLLEG
ncbi:MAG: sugar phosphate isomerase/epimerase family protein [Thermoguttaceae bacterium]|nr:sugar phosphate isomerase/epimerase family protein [Thermoguttaceae bacterium]